MAVSKNSKNGSKVKEVIRDIKKKPKKEVLKVELTSEVYQKLKENKSLTEYDGKPIKDIITFFGKKYLLLLNE